MISTKKYYAVEAKCGHVRKKNCIIITFAVIAENKKEAAKIAREIPRVKHHQKDAIQSVKEISKSEYDTILEINSNDMYLRVQSIQEQKRYCTNLYDRIIQDSYYDEEEKEYNRMERIKYYKKKISSYLKLSTI